MYQADEVVQRPVPQWIVLPSEPHVELQPDLVEHLREVDLVVEQEEVGVGTARSARASDFRQAAPDTGGYVRRYAGPVVEADG